MPRVVWQGVWQVAADGTHDPGMVEPMTGPPDAHPSEGPVHRRTMEIEVYDVPSHTLRVVGTLRDTRPWADPEGELRDVHDMELTVDVRRSDLTITAVRARMHRFPHAECPAILPAFDDLVGLSVARGYTRAVQERLGRARGCTHLELLARTLGPAVIQALPSAAARDADSGVLAGASGVSPVQWLANSCHVWRTGGPGERKLAVGWRPLTDSYPAPTAEELEDRAAKG